MKKLFTLIVAAFMAVSVNAQTETPLVLGGKQQVFHDVSVVHFPILLKQGYKTA